VERIVHGLEPQLVVYDVQSMTRALGGGRGLFPVRVSAIFAALFGGLALAIAVVGVHGLASSAARQRRREIGVRVALGARPGDIRRLVLRDGLALVGAGLGAGLVVALGGLRLLGGLLFGVSARDPLTFAAVAPVLGAVALLAYAVPAFRAARVDPTVALRDE
jgi:ABC-type antimicrobial peptide transport system permease subunit